MSAHTPAAVRERLDHPIIDADGHVIEFLPAAMDHLRDLAGDDAVKAFEQVLGAGVVARGMPLVQRRAAAMPRMTWWAWPSRNGRDRATGMLPGLFYERMDELGIDFAVLYATVGLTPLSLDVAELRRAGARAFNRYYMEEYGRFADRLT